MSRRGSRVVCCGLDYLLLIERTLYLWSVLSVICWTFFLTFSPLTPLIPNYSNVKTTLINKRLCVRLLMWSSLFLFAKSLGIPISLIGVIVRKYFY